MKFKEIKPGMIIHCPRIEDARTLSEHLIKLGVTNANHIMEYYGLDNGVGRIDSVRIMQRGRGLHAEYSDRKWYEKDGYQMKITEFSDLVEYESRFKVGDKVKIREGLAWEMMYGSCSYQPDMGDYSSMMLTITSIVRDGTYTVAEDGGEWRWTDEMLEPVGNSAGKEKLAEMSAEDALEWMHKADADTIYKALGIGRLDEALFNYEPQEFIRKIAAYEAAKKAPKQSAEVEEGYRCRIYYTPLENEDFYMYGVTEEEAKCEVIRRIKEYVAKEGRTASGEIMFVCRIKEEES